ncbi:MAG: gamma-glutamyl-gamma-aminobutyrate hydrolase family protein [Dehalococcoidia bacterium]|nr:gamma-glutamyl-gamma-aminobutyrate hydrolase family protein [Dehalococcoidia bacterium]
MPADVPEESRPIVLITRAEEVVGEDWEDYARCVQRAGGEPVALDCGTFTGVDDLPPHDGILVTAGVDIDPARYGQQRTDRVPTVDPDRDTVEGILIEYALASGLPLFCICRGFQLLNVTRGGSLLQHLEEREPHRARRGADGVSIESGWHEVTVRGNSLLAAITGSDEIRVNSRHHQAVLASGLGPDVLATGIAPDGVIEAIEVPGHPWALGVQWHPERVEMSGVAEFQDASTALFESFVAACREHAEALHA